jgi:hypothetical protein
VELHLRIGAQPEAFLISFGMVTCPRWPTFIPSSMSHNSCLGDRVKELWPPMNTDKPRIENKILIGVHRRPNLIFPQHAKSRDAGKYG